MGRPARSAESALFEQAYPSQPFTQVRVGHSLTAAYAEQDGFSRGSGPGPRRRKEVRDRQPLSAAVDTRPSPWTACMDSRLSTDFEWSESLPGVPGVCPSCKLRRGRSLGCHRGCEK